MAAYHRMDDLVICGLTVCTPGSAPCPTLGVEYEKPLRLPSILARNVEAVTGISFPFYVFKIKLVWQLNSIA